ncbi:MAG: hypothetical protein R3330_16395 [Saprospiraceae bacterium]|nr:hypothetical protein [Saprospiraceae bacterium]
MSFGVTPTQVDAGTLASGDSIDIPVTFTDVPPDVSGTGTVVIELGSVSVNVGVLAVADNPEPVVSSIDLDPALVAQGVSVTVPSIDTTGAVIRIARA